jgi:SAM-dependent methyltransferase
MPLPGLPMNEQQYADEWMRDAREFVSRGDYPWMAELLGVPTVVLEVGCGSGDGTLALVGRGHAVVGIEANEALLVRARANWSGAGVPVEELRDDPSEPSARRILVVAASIEDQTLDTHLAHLGIGAIACWNIGAGPVAIARSVGRQVSDLDPKTDVPEYRRRIHQRCYELGRLLLGSEGVVHIVDRYTMVGPDLSSHGRREVAEDHQRIAGPGYDIGMEDVALRRLPVRFASSHIQYHHERETDPSTSIVVLASLRARRI